MYAIGKAGMYGRCSSVKFEPWANALGALNTFDYILQKKNPQNAEAHKYMCKFTSKIKLTEIQCNQN